MEINIGKEIKTKWDIINVAIIPAFIFYIVLLLLSILERAAWVESIAPNFLLVFAFFVLINTYTYFKKKWTYLSK